MKKLYREGATVKLNQDKEPVLPGDDAPLQPGPDQRASEQAEVHKAFDVWWRQVCSAQTVSTLRLCSLKVHSLSCESPNLIYRILGRTVLAGKIH